MSSINPHFTFNYSQPDEYRFSHDSVFLARQVFEYVRDQNLHPQRALDVCSGCGIIGMDYLFHCRQEQQSLPADFDFVEIQNIYAPHFVENKKRLGTLPTEVHLLQLNYSHLRHSEFSKKYDLILCNPPYFRAGQGKMSPSEFKNRCRFYLDSDFKTLLLAIENALSDEGKAFILLRDLADHGWNAFGEAQEILSNSTELHKIGDIRGTAVVCMSRKNSP